MNIYLQLEILAFLSKDPTLINHEQQNTLTKVMSKVFGELDEDSALETYKNLLKSIRFDVELMSPNDILVNQNVKDYVSKEIESVCSNLSEKLQMDISLETSQKLTSLFNQDTNLDISLGKELVEALDKVIASLGNPKEVEALDLLEGIRRLAYLVGLIKLLASHSSALVNMSDGNPIYHESEVIQAQGEAEIYAQEANWDAITDDEMMEPLMIVEGVEDLLNGKYDTSAYAFIEGAAIASGTYRVTGNEGPKFEAIKDMGRKAIALAKESFDSFIKRFGPANNEERIEQLSSVAERNKKLLQGVKDQAGPIKDASAEGLATLSSEADPSGKLKQITSGLKKVSDGYLVIDKLLAAASSVLKGDASGLTKSIAEAKESIRELEKTISSSGKGNEDNNDVVADNRKGMQDQVNETKEKLKTLREQEAKIRKSIDAIAKIINNITPKIFSEDKKEDKDE